MSPPYPLFGLNGKCIFDAGSPTPWKDVMLQFVHPVPGLLRSLYCATRQKTLAGSLPGAVKATQKSTGGVVRISPFEAARLPEAEHWLAIQGVPTGLFFR